MLLLSPLTYYEAIRIKFPNSYLAEDVSQVIIGIDCEYISSEDVDFAGLESYFLAQNHKAPFAGLFGVLGYESVRYFEKIPKFQTSQYEFPNFLYANAKAYLHFDKTSKIYTFYGDRARYYEFLKELKEPNLNQKESFYQICTNLQKEQEHFEKIFQKAQEYLASGDVFQVVLSEQMRLISDMDSFEFYKILSKANPSPYMFHFPTPYADIVGSSPELVCEIKNSQIFVSPIAGTRSRGKDAIEDEKLKSELISDEKELAEHKMLIDLARNDIGRVAKRSTIKVKNPMHVVFYESVMHMASDVFGEKRDDVSGFDVIASVFPSGTLSGTPKIRAMQIISELESYQRNAYGGGIGFFHFNGDVQKAILIRSAIFTPLDENLKAKFDPQAKISNVFIQAGAGIVVDSVASSEYKEICKKRASVLNVFKNHCKELK